MSAKSLPLNFSDFVTPGKLYVGTTPPAHEGISTMFAAPPALCNSFLLIGASEPQKLTVLSVIARIPPPEPID